MREEGQIEWQKVAGKGKVVERKLLCGQPAGTRPGWRGPCE